MDTVELKRRFGRKVKALRERAGLTQEELAEKINRTVDAVGNIERGVHATKIEIAYLISLAVDAPFSDLFDLDHTLPEDRIRRKELNLLMQELQPLDLKTLQAFRRLAVSVINTAEAAKHATPSKGSARRPAG